MKLTGYTLLLLAATSGGAMAGKKKKKNKKSGSGGKHKGCTTFYLEAEFMFAPGGGGGANKGDQLLWSEGKVSTSAPGPHFEDHLVGVTSGHCLTLTDRTAQQYCQSQITFKDDHHTYGTLTSEGAFDGVAGTGLLTITGGSGEYKGVKGFVRSGISESEVCFE